MSEEQLIQTPCVFGENGNFLLERELGRGGMGGVYMGRDKMLDRPVAVKVMLREYGSDAAFVERFKKEAQSAAKLIHPNIAQIYSYGIADGMPYIAMELVAGGSLDQIMRNYGGKGDVTRILKIGEQVAQALRCASDHGLVHGDIKPENILLDSNGNAKLVDFGLAAMQNDTDEIWGTPYYIAPEKVRRDKVDFRADIYSLGGTLYHALCGVAPFEGEDAPTVVRKRFEFIPQKPSDIRSELSPQIDELIMRMLAFDPADRYLSVEALLADFKSVFEVGISSTQMLKPSARSAATTSNEQGGSGGKKKLTIKPRGKLSIKRNLSTSASAEDDSLQDTPDVSEGFKVKNIPQMEDLEEEGQSENLGAKVAMVVGGVILAILCVAGGLWYMVAKNDSDNKEKIEFGSSAKVQKIKEELANDRELCSDGHESIKSTYAEYIKATTKYVDEYKATLREYNAGSQEIIEGVWPPKTAKLIAAENALNPPKPVQDESKTNVGDASSQATPEAAEAKKPVVTVEKFPDPVDDEADPNSPAGQEYLEKKAKWEAEQKAKKEKANAAEAAAEEQNNEDAQAAAQEEFVPPPNYEDLKAIIIKVYDMYAVCLEIDKRLGDVLTEIDNSGSLEFGDLEKLHERAKAAYSAYDNDRKKVQKDFQAACRKMQDLVKKTKNKLSDIKLEQERKAQEALKKKMEEEQEQERIKKRAEKVEEEITKAKNKFEELAGMGVFRQLDWAAAERQLTALSKEFETAEGRTQIEYVELKKVKMMKSVHEIFVKNLPGYTFSSRRNFDKVFKDAKVEKVDQKEMLIKDKTGKGSTKRVSWQTFYAKHHQPMTMLWQDFIRDGRKNGTLNSAAYVEAQLGFALTIKIVCPDVLGADKAIKNSVIEALKINSQNKKFVEETFPEIDLAGIEAEASSNSF